MRTLMLVCLPCLILLFHSSIAQTDTYLIAGDSITPGIVHTSAASLSLLTSNTFPGNGRSLDLDGNGSNDFLFINAYTLLSPYTEIKIVGVEGNGSVPAPPSLCHAFAEGDTIFITDSFEAENFVRYTGPGSMINGEFVVGGDSAMIGIRLANGGSVKLGWIRIHLEPQTHPSVPLASLRFIDYALGYTMVSVQPPIPVTDFSLHPNPATNSVRIASSREGNFQIRDLQGRLLMENIATREWTADVSMLPKGIYVVEYVVEGERAVKKLVVD